MGKISYSFNGGVYVELPRESRDQSFGMFDLKLERPSRQAKAGRSNRAENVAEVELEENSYRGFARNGEGTGAGYGRRLEGSR